MDLIDRGPHLVTVVTPIVRADRYQSQWRSYGPDAPRRPAPGWIQHKATTDLDRPERKAGHETGLVFYTHATIRPLERIEYDQRVYEVDGNVYPTPSPSGTHHYQVPLRLVEG